MAEFVEHGLHDQEWPLLAKVARERFGLALSPYDEPPQVLVAILGSLGVAAKQTETLDSLLVKLLNRVS
jgi:hypothetical protein